MQKEKAIKEYLQAEYRLFSVNGKIPAIKEWQKTSINPFASPADFPKNFGINLTSEDLVIDIDVSEKKDGTEKQGRTSFNKLAKDICCDCSNTLAVKTGSGGIHFYFKKPPGVKVQERWPEYPDIEFKSVGRYVVGAGSIHPDTKKEYKIVQGEITQVKEAPTKLLELIKKEAHKKPKTQGIETYTDDEQTLQRCRQYLSMAKPAVEGSGGDQDTFIVACRCRSFGISPHATLELLLEGWNKRCDPPWEPGDLQTKIDNAYAYDTAPLGVKSPKSDFDGIPVKKKYVWIGKTRKDGVRPTCLKNTVNYLDIDPELNNLFKFNMFSEEIEFTRAPIWYPERKPLVPWTDGDAIQLKFHLASKQLYDANVKLIHEATYIEASLNSYHPLRDYLTDLSWDGIPRIDTWLIDYASVADTEYTRIIGQKTLLAAVARVFDPGCKFDNILVIEGSQRIGKSRLIDALGKEWYGDLVVDPHSKDTIADMRNKWIIELAEMETVRKVDVNAFKRFLSCRVDRTRLSYRINSEDYPRQCIFIGTINPEEGCGYLRDTTGNGRFWPVEVNGPVRVDKMEEDVDQLWAEAVSRYKNGETDLHIADEGIREFAEREAEKRRSIDPWHFIIKNWLNTPTHEVGVRMHTSGEQVFVEALDGIKTRFNRPEQSRIAIVMRDLGWRKGTYRCKTAKRTLNGYLRPKPVEEDLL